MPDAANLVQLCREAAAYAADMGQGALGRCFESGGGRRRGAG